MSALPLVTESIPDWVIAEMPPGYQNRVIEIQRLSEEIRSMDRFGCLLWRVGDELTEAVRDAFVALGFEAERTQGSTVASVTVKLDAHRRLLLHLSATNDIIQKKSTELAHVFQLLHEVAEDVDRVVLVTNSHPRARPEDRPESIEPEALNLLRRLGANVLPGPTLFSLWTLSLQDRDRARAYVGRWHEQDGGTLQLPTVAAL
jgi:hypothetical protein